LANQMLALAKFEQVVPQPLAPVALAEVVRQVALDLSPLIGAKGLDFELQAADVNVLGQDWMLRELTRNLLANAMRETAEGGKLLVVVGHDAEGPLLRIADSGPGISAEFAERLYEPFHSGRPGGSGLGLAICRQVCDHLGGRIELINRLEDGKVVGLDAVVHLRPAP